LRKGKSETINMSKKKQQIKTENTMPEGFNILDWLEVPIDTKAIQIEKGRYLSRHIVDVGDYVRLGRGEIGKVIGITQANYLPRFRINRKWHGKTKLRTKFIPKNIITTHN
jgi:hypothetical protein